MTRAGSRHILFVDHAAVLGGAELSLLDIAAGLRERCSVALMEHGPFEDRLRAAGVAVHIVGDGAALRGMKKESRAPSPRAVIATVRLARMLASVARDHAVICANSPKSFLISVVAGALARRPVIWYLRDILDRSHFSRINGWLLTRAANWRAMRVIANSGATADAFVASGGRRAIVRVIHNGIDPSAFDAADANARPSIRSLLGIPEDAFVVGCFSRLHPWKGQHVLLDAVADLPDVHVLIVGGALFSGDGAYESQLRQRAESAALRGRVHMVGARSDVPELMAACDVIAHTSVSPEPFGRVIVEALLARRPLIASKAGGVLEIVRDGTHALLTTPGDAGALRHAIVRVRNDHQLAARLVEAGDAHARAHFSRAAMVTAAAHTFDDVLEGVAP